MTRELDAAVAKALDLDVLGEAWARPFPDGGGDWSVGDREWEGRSLQPVWLAHCVCELYADEEPDEWTPEKVLGHYPGCLEVVSFYSEDIAASYQVVEWMNRDKKWIVRVLSMWDGSAEVEVYTNAGTPSHWRDVADADADTVPEAICLAFLAAMGVDWREEE